MSKKDPFFVPSGTPKVIGASAGKRNAGDRQLEQQQGAMPANNQQQVAGAVPTQAERRYVGAGHKEGDVVDPKKLKDVGWDVVN